MGNKLKQNLTDIYFAMVMPWRLAKRMDDRDIHFSFLGIQSWLGVLVVPAMALVLFLAHELEISAFQSQLPAPQAGLMAVMSEGIITGQGPPLSQLLSILGVGIPCWLVGGILAGTLGGSMMLGLLALALLASGKTEQNLVPIWKVASRSCVWFFIGAIAYVLQVNMWVDATTEPLQNSMLAVVAIIFGSIALWGFSAIIAGWLVHNTVAPVRAWITGLVSGLACVLVLMVVTGVAWNTSIMYRWIR